MKPRYDFSQGKRGRIAPPHREVSPGAEIGKEVIEWCNDDQEKA